MGGLNIIDSVHSAPSNYDTLRKLTDPIIGTLKGLNDFDLDMLQIHCETVQKEQLLSRSQTYRVCLPIL